MGSAKLHPLHESRSISMQEADPIKEGGHSQIVFYETSGKITHGRMVLPVVTICGYVYR